MTKGQERTEQGQTNKYNVLWAHVHAGEEPHVAVRGEIDGVWQIGLRAQGVLHGEDGETRALRQERVKVSVHGRRACQGGEMIRRSNQKGNSEKKSNNRETHRSSSPRHASER